MTIGIPVEQIGSERQRIPALLINVERTIGTIQFSPNHNPIKVALSDLQLAPSAFASESEDFPLDIDSHPSGDQLTFCPRDAAEVWLEHGSTSKKKLSSTPIDTSNNKTEDKSLTDPSGAWWPARILTIQSGFAHVEVAAPLTDITGNDEQTTTHSMPHLLGIGPAVLPYRSTLVKLEEVRRPWTGQRSERTLASHFNDASQRIVTANFMKDSSVESATLLTPNVLFRHTICIPAYLSRLANTIDSHSALVRFCGAPCLIQCDPEPFLPSAFAKQILGSVDDAADTESQTSSTKVTCMDADSITSLSTSTYIWPSPVQLLQSPLMNSPNIAGTLNPAGITDPAILLAGLPGSNGPLVALHIWSGSSEAIRRASFLELGHVRLLACRYHVLKKLSKGETGDLDLSCSTDLDAENVDTPVMHCKPISIPISATNDKPGGRMIGYEGRFRILPRLIGLAIGSHGSTIQQARGLPGVRAVELLPDGIVRVEAETTEACNTVRNMLDYIEAEIPVSSRLASRLIGSKGMNIRKLADSAGVRRALLLDPLTRKRQQMARRQRQFSAASDHEPASSTTDDETMNGEKAEPPELKSIPSQDENASQKNTEFGGGDLPPPAFYLLGTRASVAKMRLLIEFQADNWNELDELEETRRNLFSQLRQSNQPALIEVMNGGGPPRGGYASRGFGRGRRNPDVLDPRVQRGRDYATSDRTPDSTQIQQVASSESHTYSNGVANEHIETNGMKENNYNMINGSTSQKSVELGTNTAVKRKQSRNKPRTSQINYS